MIYFALMFAGFIVARMVDQLATRIQSEATRGASIVTAIAAAGLAVYCAARIIVDAARVQTAVESLLR